MSYARFGKNSEFYAFPEGEEHKLKIYFSREIGDGIVSLTKEQVRQLKEICERYLKDYA